MYYTRCQSSEQRTARLKYVYTQTNPKLKTTTTTPPPLPLPPTRRRPLRRHEQPPDREDDAHARADAERGGGARGLEDRAADEAAEEEREDGEQLVVAADDAAAELEELRVGHELAPDGGEDDWARARRGQVSAALKEGGRRRRRTGGCELGVDALAHDALQAQTSADKRQTHKRPHVRPRGGVARARDAALAALPERERGGHGEQRLDEGAECEPRAGACAEAVADAAEGGAEDEGEDGGEGLLVGEAEGGVVARGRILEEAGEGEGELRVFG